MATIAQNLPLCKHRYALIASYMGTKYLGSQRLVHREKTGIQDTIQEALEVALEGVFPRARCRLTGASRTDRGVHALMNCYTLPLMDYSCPTDRVKRQVNNSLVKKNHEIIVNEVLLAPVDFHPRRNCVSREYIYRIGVPKSSGSLSRANSVNSTRELFQAFPASELHRILPVPHFNLDKVEEAANLLRGVHDFASFSFQPTERDITIRELEIDIRPVKDLTFEQEIYCASADIYHLHFKSHAFLHNQVRRLVGAILSYATYETVELSDIQKLLDKPDSKCWDVRMPIAEPYGLYLSRLDYPKSAFEGTKRTYDTDPYEEDVDLDSIPGAIEMSDDDEMTDKNDERAPPSHRAID